CLDPIVPGDPERGREHDEHGDRERHRTVAVPERLRLVLAHLLVDFADETVVGHSCLPCRFAGADGGRVLAELRQHGRGRPEKRQYPGPPATSPPSGPAAPIPRSPPPRRGSPPSPDIPCRSPGG